MRNVGAIVIMLGIVMTTLTGFNTVSRTKVVDLGVVEIRKNVESPVYWSPVTGVVLIVVGAMLVMAGNKKEYNDKG